MGQGLNAQSDSTCLAQAHQNRSGKGELDLTDYLSSNPKEIRIFRIMNLFPIPQEGRDIEIITIDEGLGRG